MRSKTPPKWQCRSCNSKMVMLSRLCKSWPPQQFTLMPQEEQQEFFRELSGKSASEVKAMVVHRLSKKLAQRARESETGKYMPLGWYERQGFDTQMIEATSTPADKQWHPRFGWAYRVDLRETTHEKEEERVREQLMEAIFREGKGSSKSARASSASVGSDGDSANDAEMSDESVDGHGSVLKEFMKARKAKEAEMKREEEKKRKEEKAAIKSSAQKAVRKITPVLKKVESMMGHDHFGSIPSIITSRVKKSHVELGHLLKHAQHKVGMPDKPLRFNDEEVSEAIAQANTALGSLKKFYTTLDDIKG